MQVPAGIHLLTAALLPVCDLIKSGQNNGHSVQSALYSNKNAPNSVLPSGACEFLQLSTSIQVN